jgi:16S rRNA (guanine527-N7)-methyltransferase
VDEEGFARASGVSRETLEKLVIYQQLLSKWQARINLVSRASLAESWHRHFLDSAQLLGHMPTEARVLVDLGSGAGFPGLVLAITAAGNDRALHTHLIDSDTRKAAFLREVAAATGVARDLTIHAARAETIAERLGPVAHIVTARALADLASLIGLARPFLAPGARCLFLKGAGVEAEFADARARWRFEAIHHPSRTDPTGCLLELRGIEYVKNLSPRRTAQNGNGGEP